MTSQFRLRAYRHNRAGKPLGWYTHDTTLQHRFGVGIADRTCLVAGNHPAAAKTTLVAAQ
jgi:hypothetical protein